MLGHFYHQKQANNENVFYKPDSNPGWVVHIINKKWVKNDRDKKNKK